MATQEELMLQKRKLELELELAEAEESEARSPEEIPTPEPRPSILESVQKGWEKGATLGLAPYVAGVGGGLGALSAGGEFSTGYEAGKAEQLAQQKAAEEANPKAFMASNIVGGAVIPGQSLTSLAAQGAISGGATEEGDVFDKVKGTVVGGLLGGAGKLGGDKIAKSAGEAIDALKPLYTKIKDSVGLGAAQQWLETQAGKFAEQAAGLERTVGQRAALEKQLMRGKVKEGEVGKLLLEKGVVKATDTSKDIAQKAFEARKAAGDELGAILKEMPEGVQPELVAQRLRDRANELQDIGSNRELKDQILALADSYLPSGMTPHGPTIPAKTAQELKIEAGGKVQDWQNSMRDPQAMLNLDIDKALKESMTPEQAARYTKANQEAAMLIPASEAAVKQSAADMGKKVLSVGAAPAIGVGYGITQGDPWGGVAAGLAFRTAQKRGPQFLAGTTWNAAKILEKAPDKFKGMLQSAMQRGEKSFATTHYLLQQRDPEYNKATTDEEE